MRAISTEFFHVPPRPSMGQFPELCWIEIKNLVVDEAYQRPIVGRSRNNIAKIAANFRWSCFAPVMVAQVGTLFAIIDGQHRTTAAAIIGIERVPCMIVAADLVEQAKAFQLVNGNVTKMSPLSIHGAAVTAQDPDALALEDVCSRADVTILRYPVSAENQTSGGQTMSVATLARCLERYGRDVLVTALQCVTQTDNNLPGALVSAVIVGLCALLEQHQDWLQSGDRLLKAFDEVDIQSTLDTCMMQIRPKGTSVANALTDRLATEVAPLMIERRLLGRR